MAEKELLYVISCISNPVRYKRRYELFFEFQKRMQENPNVKFYSVELQHGEREFVTDSILKIRTKDELWHKENLLNLIVQRLPENWKYLAWIDADIIFLKKDWAEETIQQLQIYEVVQLFSHAIDSGPNGEVMHVHKSFLYQYHNCKEPYHWSGGRYGYWHPGFAWGCTKEAYNAMGGFFEYAVVGSADWHMALALTGNLEQFINTRMHINYQNKLKILSDRCEKNIKRNVGFVYGTIFHEWHGKKQNRVYKDRWKILIDNNFDPEVDLFKDCNGVWQLNKDNIKLRDELRSYFRGRNEDGIDL